MTAPTITYGHGYLTDCDTLTGWGGPTNSADPLTGVALTLYSGDYLGIAGTCDAAADEFAYYEDDIPDISSDTYTHYVVRWRTSAWEAPGLGARVRNVFSAGAAGYQDLLESAGVPQFDRDWVATSGTNTSGKTISHVYIYADDNPDSLAAGSYNTYFDFILLCKGVFTFPGVQPGGVSLHTQQKIAQLEIPGRHGDILQRLGMKSTEITVKGSVLSGESWGSPDLEIFYEIMQNDDPWQWFTSDIINCKVMFKDFRLGQVSDSGFQRDYELTFLTYSLADLSGTMGDNKQWFGM